MATIQATNVTNLSIAARPQELRYKGTFHINPLLGVAAECNPVQKGDTANRHLSLADATAASLSENAAVTGSATPTIEADTSSLASVGIAFELTSEAINSIVDFEGYLEKLKTRAMEAVSNYIASDGTAGLAALIASLTAYGASGSVLTFNTVRLAATAIYGAVGHCELIAIIDAKGKADIQRDLESSGASNFANQAMSPLIEALFVEGGMPDGLGYTGIRYEGISFFVTNRSSQLYATGGDTYGVLTVVPYPSQAADRKTQSAFLVDYRENPTAASSMWRAREAKIETDDRILGEIPVGMFYSEPATSGADTVKMTWKATFDALLGDAAAAAALRYLS